MSRRPTPRAAPARVALVRCCPHDGQVRIASVTSPRGGVRPAARSTPPRSPRRWPDSGRTSWQSRGPTPGGPARTTSPARTTPINVTCRVAPWRRWTGDGLRRWRARPAPHTRGARSSPWRCAIPVPTAEPTLWRRGVLAAPGPAVARSGCATGQHRVHLTAQIGQHAAARAVCALAWDSPRTWSSDLNRFPRAPFDLQTSEADR